MPVVKAFPFPNPTGQIRFEGKTLYEGTLYDYKIFLTPLQKSTPDYDYVVKEISGRRQKGSRKACLGTTKKIIEQQLNQQITSAYGFVNPVGSKDTVSGSVQLYQWDTTTTDYQVWINDLCRNTPSGAKKHEVSPLYVLFMLFEQMAAQMLGKTVVYLFVDRENEPVLVPLYQKYGFSVDNDFNTTGDAIIMKKPIVKLDAYNGFPFIVKPSDKSSKSKRNRTQTKRSQMNRTQTKRSK
jgi:hypothetical protein